MPGRMVVTGQIGTVRVTLVDVTQPTYQFPEIVAPEGNTPEWDAVEFKARLEAELTGEARRLLDFPNVSVAVEFDPGSLEVIAAIAVVGEIVAGIGAFFDGVRAIRVLFPERIRDRVAGWLGRPVAAASARFETGDGVFDATAEPEKDKTGPGAGEASVKELAAYAALALAVLVVVVGAVIGGLALLGAT
jgi:hypothetical protein